MKRLLAVLAVLALFSPGVMADIIIFQSGGAREGIIEEETPTSVKMRIKNAVIGFSRGNIERIEYSSSAENSKLDQKWKEEEKQQDEKRKQRREDKKRSEKRQSDKGLEKVNGQWVSRKKKAEIKQDRIEAEIRGQEAVDVEEALELERAAVAAEAEKASEENRLPDYIKKIVVGKFRVKDAGEGEVVIHGRITNKGKLIAELIILQAGIYDQEGTLVNSIEEQISDLGPNKHQKLEFPFDMNSSVIGSTEVTVSEVVWR